MMVAPRTRGASVRNLHKSRTPRIEASRLSVRGRSIRQHQQVWRQTDAALYEAAKSHLRISKKWSTLRAWGIKLAKRIGANKACVAVARELAIIMHRMWVEETDFRFGMASVTQPA